MDFPPVALAVTGTDAEQVDPKATPVTFVGDPIVGVCGTDVAVAEFDAVDAKELPYPFVAVTVKVNAVLDGIPVTTTGVEDPLAEYPPDVEVAVNEDANPPPVFGVNATETAALLNSLFVPTSVAVPIVGVNGITPN